MRRVVFYTWQSDLPNATNRSFIQQALQNVVTAIAADDGIEVEPVIDRDTQGVAGAPDIARTIFSKIGDADVVVADVSIVGRTISRPMPNPNVLIELGYALKALGDERVVLVFNAAYGRVEELPFDLKMRRVTLYTMPEAAPDRSTERRVLERKLDLAIRAALSGIKKPPVRTLVADAIDGIERVAPNRIVGVRALLADLFAKFEEGQPPSFSKGGTGKEWEEAINKTSDLVAQFSQVAGIAALMDDFEITRALYRGIGPLIEKYDLPEGFSGHFSRADFDFWRFLGHELLTTIVACLIREERWETISRVLSEGIPVRYRRDDGGPATCYFNDVSAHLAICDALNRERRRLCVHADILESRHGTQGILGELMPFEQFLAADYFLFLRGELRPDMLSDVFLTWRPWSALYLKSAPQFIRDAENALYANRIASALGLADFVILRSRLTERAGRLGRLFSGGFWSQPLRQGDIDKIGTR